MTSHGLKQEEINQLYYLLLARVRMTWILGSAKERTMREVLEAKREKNQGHKSQTDLLPQPTQRSI
jgi:hypothetical protein